MTQNALVRAALAVVLSISVAAGAIAQDAPPPEGDNPVKVSPPKDAGKNDQQNASQPATRSAKADNRVSALDAAMNLSVRQVAELLIRYEAAMEESKALRKRMADGELELATVRRELAELEQFMADHDAYGRDFIQYRGVKEVAEREARRRAAEEKREEYEEGKAEQRRRRQEVNALRKAERAEDRRERRYANAGFNSIGQEVYLSSMSFQYKQLYLPDDGYIRTRGVSSYPFYRYGGHGFSSFGFGFQPFSSYYWHRPKIIEIDYDPALDYTAMSLSGSVLNGLDEPRNVGVAIAFFDEGGNQIGGDTVEIESARTDVPYPFTLELTMSRNQPFYSYRINVLYSDQAAPATE